MSCSPSSCFPSTRPTRRFSPRAAWPLALLLHAVLASWAGPAAAAVWHVPADVTTIQAGIDSAASGDTVLVADGTYTGTGNRNLDFGGKELVLRSEHGPGLTVIDCLSADRGIHFHMGEGPAAVVDGFTIRRGLQQDDRGPGGIWIQRSQPTIRNCVITENEGMSGGGVQAFGASGTTFENCIITGNTADGGGGVWIESCAPTFVNCDIIRNWVASEGSEGGGIYCYGGEEPNTPVFVNCLIAENQAGSESVAGGDGGGIFVAFASPTLVNCTISGNCATGWGGGIASLSGDSRVILENSILWGNAAAYAGDEAWAYGPGDTLSFYCSAVDSSRIEPGTGTEIYVAHNLFTDPLFCHPSCSCPADSGTAYTLASNSPCLAEASPCGELIGARGQDCGTVVVWTGGGDGESWSDPDNWSTGSVPQPGDHVQITRGNGEHILLREAATIDELTMCGRGTAGGAAYLGGSLPDTLQIADAGQLTTHRGRGTEIINLTAGDKLTDNPMLAPSGRFLLDTGVFHNLPGGELVVDAGTVGGSGAFLNGPGASFVKRGPGVGEIGLHFINPFDPALRPPLEGPSGLHVLGGTLVVSGLVDNGSVLAVGEGTTLEVAGRMNNLGSGTCEVFGFVTGGGEVDNFGRFTKAGGGASGLPATFNNLRDEGEGAGGQLEVVDGMLVVDNLLENHANVTVGLYTKLDVQGRVNNREDGFFELTGWCTGGGRIDNGGLFRKVSAGASELACTFNNLSDPEGRDRGQMEVTAGTLNATAIDNSGMVSIARDAAVAVSSSFVNEVNATVEGSGTLNFSEASFTNRGIMSPGVSPGTLTLVGDFSQSPTAEIRAEVGGLEPSLQYDVLRIAGAASLDGALHVTYLGGFTPSVGDSFRVIQIDSSGIGLSALPLGGGFQCFSGLQLPGGVFMRPVLRPDAFWLVAVDSIPANHPPVAHPDKGSTDWFTPLTLALLENDSDLDGDPLTIAAVATPNTAGTVYIDAGDTTVTYLPRLFYVGVDSFAYYVTDCQGGVDSAVVAVMVGDASSVPPALRVPDRCALYPSFPNPFNPVTTIRFDLPEAGPMELAIFDVTGRRVKVLAKGYGQVGSFSRSWEGRDEYGREVAPGVYFVRLTAGDYVGAQKIVLAK